MHKPVHRMDILRKHVDRWLHTNGFNQQAITACVVDKFFEIGLSDTLQHQDITFARTADAYRDLEANRMKLFRWFGHLGDGAKISESRLFYVEPAIVAAMPVAIRTSYLNEVYADSNVWIGQASGGGVAELSAVVCRITKENCEAQVALIEYLQSQTSENLQSALKEMREALAMMSGAEEALTSHNVTHLKSR